MKLTSPAFSENGIIPSKYTCEGKSLHPPLLFHDVPTQAKSLCLIVEDPDVPETIRKDRMFDHWVIFNIPPDVKGIAEGAPPPGVEGKNTTGKSGYTPPCPPDREHRYFFKLFALKHKLNLPHNASKKEVLTAMEGHILAECSLIGRYELKKGY